MEAKSVAVDSLKEFIGNPRKGNIKELVESLKANGQYKPIVVQKSTKQILAGNP
jgi:ParB-like chromosome segregation protein Spo0J